MGGFDVGAISDRSTFALEPLESRRLFSAAYFPFGAWDLVNVVPLKGGGMIVATTEYGWWEGRAISQLARLNPDGSIDTSFAYQGYRQLGGFIQQVSVADDGRIFVLTKDDDDSGASLVTFNRRGRYDEFTYIAPGDNGERVEFDRFAFQPDGKVVLAGVIHDARAEENGHVIVRRYEADGERDWDYGDEGSVRLAGVSEQWVDDLQIGGDGSASVLINDWANDSECIAVVSSDGRVRQGRTDTGMMSWDQSRFLRDGSILQPMQSDEFMLGRFDRDGRMVPGFGPGGGHWVGLGRTKNDNCYDIVEQSDDGKVVVVWNDGPYAPEREQNVQSLARMNPDGTLDSSFGHGGAVRRPIGADHPFSTSVSIADDGAILVAEGVILDDYGAVMQLRRYFADGSLDTTFGDDGVQTLDSRLTPPQPSAYINPDIDPEPSDDGEQPDDGEAGPGGAIDVGVDPPHVIDIGDPDVEIIWNPNPLDRPVFGVPHPGEDFPFPDLMARTGYDPVPSDENVEGDADGDASDDQTLGDDSEVYDDEETTPFGADQDELWDA